MFPNVSVIAQTVYLQELPTLRTPDFRYMSLAKYQKKPDRMSKCEQKKSKLSDIALVGSCGMPYGCLI